MPYICLSRADVPDGTIQILDLQPNTSQANPSIDGPGQTRYVNRALNQAPTTSGANPILAASTADGLAAYILDNVVLNGLTRAGGQTVTPTINVAGVTTLTIDATAAGGGATVFTAAAAENLALRQFLQGGGIAGDDIATGTSLAACINHTAGNGARCLATVNPANGVVTLRAEVYGATGNAITAVSSDAVNLTVSASPLAGAGIGSITAANALIMAARIVNRMSLAITGSSVATPSVITMSAVHGFVVGDVVNVVGHSIAALNGTHVVSSTPAPTTLTLEGIGAAVAGTGGTIAADLTGVDPGAQTYDIVTSGIGATDTITTATNHLLAIGDVVTIVGHSDVAYNANHVVLTVPLATTFTIATVGVVGGTGGTVTGPVRTLGLNSIVQTVAGCTTTEIINMTGTSDRWNTRTFSQATLAEILQILAGRSYRLTAGASIAVGAGAASTKGLRTGSFLTTVAGTARNIKGIRATYNSAYLAQSKTVGELSKLDEDIRLFDRSYMNSDAGGATGVVTDAAGNLLRKYPYHGLDAGLPRTGALVATNNRVVTVYNDDGSLY